MKIFIWNNPYHISCGGSYLYAIAETEEEARAIAMKAKRFNYGEFEEDNNRLNEIQLGKPDRIHDLPYAELYEWSE